ncbi:MAG: hypothetical protein EHM80_02800 [Nitrospiraceae bacterium]|nr:MAG: hypothetical protein EHM80_02800 [Nitrospiraceae bacterium]
MRVFATLRSQFWTGTTGKAITGAGKDARIVATYLLTCEHANMIGLYRLPLLYVSEETGLKRREVVSALEQLGSLEFAVYDPETEFVWVCEMARYQLDLLPHEAIKEGDHRAQGAARLYKQLSSNPFLLPFYERYAQILRLPLQRDFLTEKKPLASPLGGSSETLIRGYVPVPDLNLVRKGEAGETKTESLSTSKVTPEKIREDWNTIPGVKACKKLGKTIRDRIQTRLNEYPSQDWWTELLQQVRASDFLCGRTNGKEGPFHASLDWILGPKVLDKLLAGNYDPVVSNGHGSKQTCTKPIQGDQFIRPCGQPASPKSRPTEPRCDECLKRATQSQKEVHAYH